MGSRRRADSAQETTGSQGNVAQVTFQVCLREVHHWKSQRGPGGLELLVQQRGDYEISV